MLYYSKLFGRSDKSEGSNLSICSHRLLVQAGYIRESVAGRYYFLPLGWRLQLKLMEIIRQEMDKAGAQEMVAPVLHPLELWQETNRESAAGFELMQLKDRRGAGFALGGTAEEMFVDVVRRFNLSYKDLPFNLYQFGLKFRDELRARGGLLRVREFIMKDAYSFSTEEQFEAVYEQMRQTYETIFTRLGLTVRVVPADGGYIGGQYCHEFIADSAVGESLYFETENGYLAHEDIAVFDKSTPNEEEALQPLKLVAAERGPTMADSFKYHQPVPLVKHIKNVVYLNEREEIILACIRGDLDVNEVKLQKITNCHQLKPLNEAQIQNWLKSHAGFISPVNLSVSSQVRRLVIVADDSLVPMKNAISGGNKLNYDYVNINLERDFKPDLTADIALTKEGYKGLDGGLLKASKGIEVGNIFQLGYHYSKKMKGAEYVNSAGKLQKYYMGCYGIGVGRTLAALAEIKSDDKGLVWPAALTPYDIYLVDLVKHASEESKSKIHNELQAIFEAAGLTVLCDDRPHVSAGEKFTNADLLGFPIRLVISEKTLQARQVELKGRQSDEIVFASYDQISDSCRRLLL